MDIYHHENSQENKKKYNLSDKPFAKDNRCRVIQDYKIPSKIRMQRKMETPEAKERYKIRSKTAERPFAHLKQNMHLTEFRTTGLQ